MAVKVFMELTINMNICIDLLALYETCLMYTLTITEIRMRWPKILDLVCI